MGISGDPLPQPRLDLGLGRGGAAAAAVPQHVEGLGERGLARARERVVDVVRGGAVRRDAVEVVGLAARVRDQERHRVEHLLAEVEAVLPDRLAVRRVAHDLDVHVRAQAVDDRLAGGRRAAGGDHHQPGGGEGLRLRLELVGGVAARLLVVVGELHEHLPHERRPRDQARQVLRDRDQPAAVVPEVEDELGGSLVAELGEGGVEGLHRGLNEVAEVDVAHPAGAGVQHRRLGDGRDRDLALHEGGALLPAREVAPGERHGYALLLGPEDGVDLARPDEVRHRLAGDRSGACPRGPCPHRPPGCPGRSARGAARCRPSACRRGRSR